MYSRSARGCSEDVLGTSRNYFSGTSLGRQIKTSPGRQTVTFLGRQLGTSQGWPNRIFRESPGDGGGGLPWDVLVVHPGDQYFPTGVGGNMVMLTHFSPVLTLAMTNEANTFMSVSWFVFISLSTFT